MGRKRTSGPEPGADVRPLHVSRYTREIAAGLEALEEELMGLGLDGGGSPDRADALVWAVTDLLVDGAGMGPRIRAL